MKQTAKIYVAGHRGLVGSALVRRLQASGFSNLLLPTRRELDLTRQQAVEDFFERERPDYVFLAAAKVGGIRANSVFAGDFIRDNLLIQTNVIESARRAGVSKLLFLGSSCIYPKFASQPIRESELMTGPLEPTNSAYAVAKIAGIEMVQAYRRQFDFPGICLMPTNLYGPGDNFDLENAHVAPALMRRFHEAKLSEAPEVTVWGSGRPRREFLHCDDLADAALLLMQEYDEAEIVNVGCGEDVSIAELAETIRDVVGYPGRLTFDASKPDGTPRKLLDVSRLFAIGWRPKIALRDGLEQAYQWYVENVETKGVRATVS
ncbi:MAG: NAD-dependent epimerase/dehydratase family protein [Acidobacteria bacterium]|nr:NAD-dependent epimerase/dehydratase family protein [Acidobacteriota bacterium]